VSPDRIDAGVVAAKTETIRSMLTGIASLPLDTYAAWTDDPRMIAAGESYLRRALEALLDLGRHVLAKGFGRAVPEYAAIADALEEERVLPALRAERLRLMARYRNRMVHGYDAVSAEELYGVLTEHLVDVPETLDALRGWIADHPEKLRGEL
jgi:uncharacterized protein YutE (UPF0331/DUF86 family)